MIMKWSDLISGDVVEFNPDFLNEWNQNRGEFPFYKGELLTPSSNVFLIIASTSEDDAGINIRTQGGGLFIITHRGRHAHSDLNEPIFRIVSLSGADQ